MTQDKRVDVIQLRIRDRERKRTARSVARETRFYAKKRPLPLRVERTIETIGEDLTTKRRRFGDRYFRSDRLLPTFFLFPSLPSLSLCVAYSPWPYRRFYEEQNGEEYRCSLRRSWSTPEDVEERGHSRGVENGSAVLRFVSRKKRTYVTHYPCCGPCSKLWLSSTSSAAHALVPRGR